MIARSPTHAGCHHTTARLEESPHGELRRARTALLKGLTTPAPAAPDAKKIDDTLTSYAGAITAESRDAWKNRLTEDFDGTLALLKGIKQAPSKTPMHKQAPAAAVSADGAQDEAAHPFLNRVNELRKADPKLGEADAMVQAASDDPALY
jgi:hypothetical protein